MPSFTSAVVLRLASLEPGSLVIEIDENDALDRRAAAERFAGEMKGIVCGLLIDGFARRSVSLEPLKALCVEEEAVLAALGQQKVGYAQGFGVREPVPIDELFKS